MLLWYAFYTTDFGSNVLTNPVSVATTVTEVSDHATAASSSVPNADPAIATNVPTPNVRRARTVTEVSDHATAASVPVPNAAPTIATNVPTPTVRRARTVTEVSDHATAASVPVPNAAPAIAKNVPTPTVRRARKRMVAGMRVSGKHGEYAATQVDGTAKKRRSKTRIYGYIIESSGNNKYLVRFDNNLEKVCSSGTLKIEAQTAAVPQNEVSQAIPTEDAVCPDPDECSSSEEEDPNIDLLQDHVVVNIGAINESADPCDEEANTNDLQDNRPDTYKDRLRAHRGRIASLIGEHVERCAGPKKNPHTKVDWVVIKDHSMPIVAEVEAARKIHDKKIGYIGIDQLLEDEHFIHPSAVSTDVTSYSQTPLRPIDVSNCTIFAKMILNLTYSDWQQSATALNKVVDSHNATQAKSIKHFSYAEFLSAHAIMIGSAIYSMNGVRLWDNDEKDDGEWDTVLKSPGFDKYMKLYRFKLFRQLIPLIFEVKELKDTDPWWQFKQPVDVFNHNRKVFHSHICLYVSTFATSCTNITCISFMFLSLPSIDKSFYFMDQDS